MNALPSAGNEVRGNFVMLRADSLRLLLPQQQVGAASYLDHLPVPSQTRGIFHRDGSGDEAFVALSQSMQPLDVYPKDRFLVTPVTTPQGKFGFGWSEVQVLIDARLQPQALPPALVCPDSPLQRFVEIGGEAVFICDAQRLADYALGPRS